MAVRTRFAVIWIRDRIENKNAVRSRFWACLNVVWGVCFALPIFVPKMSHFELRVTFRVTT